MYTYICIYVYIYIYRVSAAIMRHLRLLQYYYLQEAYWDFNFGIDIHQLI